MVITVIDSLGITVELDSFTVNIGTYTLTLNVSDAYGNPAFERTVTFTVLEKEAEPSNLIITINDDADGDSLYFAGTGATFTYPGVFEAFEYKDGTFTDLQASVTIDKTVNTAIEGEYIVVYTLTNSEGETVQDQIVVTVLTDDEIPTISLLGKSKLFIKEGETYVDPGVKVSDNFDNDLAKVVAITAKESNGNPVAVSDIGNKAGIYTLTYTVSDNSGNQADPITREVEVVGITVATSSDLNHQKSFIVNGMAVIKIPSNISGSQLEIKFLSWETMSMNINGSGVSLEAGMHGRYVDDNISGDKLITIHSTEEISVTFHSW